MIEIKRTILNQYFLLVFSLMFFNSGLGLSCSNPLKTIDENNQTIGQSNDPKSISDLKQQLGEYIINIFEDSKGNLWIGTLQKGVARYDGESLTYFTTDDGLIGNGVCSIVEDEDGILWFGTHSGLSKYDGGKFVNYTVNEGLCHDRISFLLIDKARTMWIGTWGGVCLFDGESFSEFRLPVPDIIPPSYQETEEWITEIMEDKKGNIWFGRSGYAVCRYDGKSFTHFTKEDGLPSNCVHAITEDRNGNIWFGTRVTERDHPDEKMRHGAGGLSFFDLSENKEQKEKFLNGNPDQSDKIIQFPELRGANGVELYSIYMGTNGNIWIGANGTGIYKYDGEKFTLFDRADNPDMDNNIRGIQSFMMDSKGRLWFGLSGGLYRLDGSMITNVTKDGPWH